MAFSEFDSSDPPLKAKEIKNAVISDNGFGGIVLPTNGWHLEILQLPFTTSVEEIQTLFTKYGAIDRVAFIYKLKDNSINCYLTYEKETDSEDALKENGKKVGTSAITVIKYATTDSDKGNKRMRTEDTADSWGSSTSTSNGWGSTANNDTSGGWGSTDAQSSNSWGGGGSDSGSSRGRGRGRGGASGGGGRACFKCGEEGHMSRECPKGGGGGGSRACFKCGEEGHMSRECPKGGGGGGGGGSRACFKCGEEGHMSRECPKGGGRACFNCGEEGHMSRECSKPRSGRGRGGGGRGGGGNFGNRSNDNDSGASEWGSSTSTPAATSSASDWD